MFQLNNEKTINRTLNILSVWQIRIWNGIEIYKQIISKEKLSGIFQWGGVKKTFLEASFFGLKNMLLQITEHKTLSIRI